MSYYLGKVKEVCELFHTDQDYLSRDGTTCSWPSPSTSAGNQCPQMSLIKAVVIEGSSSQVTLGSVKLTNRTRTSGFRQEKMFTLRKSMR